MIHVILIAFDWSGGRGGIGPCRPQRQFIITPVSSMLCVEIGSIVFDLNRVLILADITHGRRRLCGMSAVNLFYFSINISPAILTSLSTTRMEVSP